MTFIEEIENMFYNINEMSNFINPELELQFIKILKKNDLNKEDCINIIKEELILFTNKSDGNISPDEADLNNAFSKVDSFEVANIGNSIFKKIVSKGNNENTFTSEDFEVVEKYIFSFLNISFQYICIKLVFPNIENIQSEFYEPILNLINRIELEFKPLNVELNIKEELPYKNLLETLKQRIQSNEIELYYWKKDSTLLMKLYTELLKEGYIDENPNFFKSFQKDPNPNHRTKWKKKATALIYLVYLFDDTNIYKDEPIYDIIPKLFVQEDGTPYLVKNINTQYNENRDKIEKRELTPSMLKISKIFESATDISE